MAITALFMGVVGGPHCVAMCGAACAGIGRAAGARSTQALLGFQASRMLGYALFGAFAAGSVQGLAWLGTNTAVLRPVWTMFHVAALLLGAALLWRARQPAWIE
ncbi:urease accessory protein UreH domain-containing protein, partial [Aeromicrobium sp.]